MAWAGSGEFLNITGSEPSAVCVMISESAEILKLMPQAVFVFLHILVYPLLSEEQQIRFVTFVGCASCFEDVGLRFRK
jgi:hypothetical protein